MEAPGGEPGFRHTGWVEKFQNSGQVRYKLDEVLKRHNLVDEYRLMVFPIVLGSGMRLFDALNASPRSVPTPSVGTIAYIPPAVTQAIIKATTDLSHKSQHQPIFCK